VPKQAAACSGECKQSHFKKTANPQPVGRPAGENRAYAMFKFATKAVKVEINLWACAALLHALIDWISS
jgi:hypothetical protein